MTASDRATSGRAVLRTAVERAATIGGLTTLLARLRGRRAAILAFHNVVETGEAGRGDASLHLPFARFVDQIDRIQRRYELVSLEAAASEPPGRRPRIVITFDDAYRGAIALALPELARRGIPCTVFVAPGLLGAESTWWDDLGEAGLLTPRTRHAALREYAGRDERVREVFLPHGPARALPRSYGIASEPELMDAAGPLVDLGSHSWRHEHLPTLGEAELRATLAPALQWVRERTGSGTVPLALPYGANSAGTMRAALDAGHATVLEIEGGLWSDDRGDRPVPRINVPAGLTPRGLELRTSGLLR